MASFFFFFFFILLCIVVVKNYFTRIPRPPPLGVSPSRLIVAPMYAYSFCLFVSRFPGTDDAVGATGGGRDVRRPRQRRRQHQRASEGNITLRKVSARAGLGWAMLNTEC